MSSSNPSLAMDVDGPSAPSHGPGTLKRCSSAPMINETNSLSVMSTANQQNSASRDHQGLNLFGVQPRTRRFSFSVVPGSPPISSGVRRIQEIRQEEDVSNSRELAHEKETHHAMQISQSWEDLSLMSESHGESKMKMGPLHVTLPAYNHMCNSPSPTRLSSPGFQSPTRGSRTFIRRSASPVLRPSPLGVKRKLEDDKQDLSPYPRAKRVYSYSAVDRGLLTTTSLPGSLSSVGTPESLSSADSPGFNFRNVDSPSPNRVQHPEPMVVSKGEESMNDSLS